MDAMEAYIPYQLRAKLQQIAPVLDLDWQHQIEQIFETTDAHLHKTIEDHYLKSKNIKWDPLKETFEFKGYVGVDALDALIRNPSIRQLGKQIQLTLDKLPNYRDVFQIADYLESVLNEIDHMPLDDHSEIQKEKHALRTAFLQDAASLIRTMDFAVPETIRKLTLEQIRCFILEVYIKREIVGDWFSVISPSDYAQQELPIFQDFLLKEQKIRDFDVIATSKFFFIIGSPTEYEQNPYSIRRFLTEESFGFEDKVYLNAVVLDPATIADENVEQDFKWQISRMITIQRQVNQNIIQLIEGLHHYNHTNLLPLLHEPLNAAGYPVDQLVNERLLDIEKMLSMHILEPLQKGLRTAIQQPDELEFSFLNIQRLMTEILNAYEDFSNQPVVLFNNQARIFKHRLVAYLKLLQKRRQQIFMLFENEEHFLQQDKLAKAPLEQMINQINQAIEQSREIQLQIRQKEREQGEKAGFLKRIFSKSEQQQKEVERLKNMLNQIREQCYMDIIRITKQYPKQSVYLESESLISINHKERNYAFANGENGVTRLPILLQLPEDRNNFNLQSVSATLNFDLSKASQLWKTI